MPQLEYFVAAESVSIDRNRNTVSVFHIFNKIGLGPIPATIPLLSAVAGWVFSEAEIAAKDEFQVRLVFETPGTESPKTFRANLNATVRFQNIHLELQDIPVQRAGDFIITLFVDDVKQATHTIEIVD